MWLFWKNGAGLLLQNQDAYLKSAGGVKLDEPMGSVAVAIASSYKDKPAILRNVL